MSTSHRADYSSTDSPQWLSPYKASPPVMAASSCPPLIPVSWPWIWSVTDASVNDVRHGRGAIMRIDLASPRFVSSIVFHDVKDGRATEMIEAPCDTFYRSRKSVVLVIDRVLRGRRPVSFRAFLVTRNKCAFSSYAW